ncbi:hypothetical protein PRIPAC_89808 [Pristionchus pacificus]|uniref:Uncharacterized protein n=1 Tax=Pristionchus pacificus TaxID=54126 RepID=A0A2A6B7D7_PRIPA|nr:hypothetical protein PRIPAC_89808 [Pristionchus pacificus]|eukprot:PDM61786.1 hypothetical protein PRIPAC_51228 [Pristionchus pacificus]
MSIREEPFEDTRIEIRIFVSSFRTLSRHSDRCIDGGARRLGYFRMALPLGEEYIRNALYGGKCSAAGGWRCVPKGQELEVSPITKDEACGTFEYCPFTRKNVASGRFARLTDPLP